MKKFFPQVLILICTVLYFAGTANGQGLQPTDARQGERPAANARGAARAELVQELGLTPEQMQEMRRINQERRPAEVAARQRFQDATRALNAAIYSDNLDEAVFHSSLKEFQAAQGELARIKFTSELAIRRLLTPEQLLKFRDLRKRFAEKRGNRRAQQPLRRLRRGARAPLN